MVKSFVDLVALKMILFRGRQQYFKNIIKGFSTTTTKYSTFFYLLHVYAYFCSHSVLGHCDCKRLHCVAFVDNEDLMKVVVERSSYSDFKCLVVL